MSLYGKAYYTIVSYMVKKTVNSLNFCVNFEESLVV